MNYSTLTILPDYNQLVIDEDGISYDIEEMPIDASLFADWLTEFQPLTIKFACGEKYVFDWERWHKEGIKLSQQYRKVLPLNIKLYYASPTEDYTHAYDDRILIEKDKIVINTCNIFYQSWQIQCCGKPFRIGDVVLWSCTKTDKPHKMKGFLIDYEEEHHHGMNLYIKGIVSSILSVTTVDEPQQKCISFDESKAILRPLIEANGYESNYMNTEGNNHYTFWGYIVTLINVEISDFDKSK